MQDFTEWECIVVDDNSTDFTTPVAQEFVDVDPRFRLLRHSESLGPSAARNTGIATARGEYICFLDDDDFFLDGSLSARWSAVRDAPVPVVGSFCDWVNTAPEIGLEVFLGDRTPKYRGRISFTSLRSGTPFILTSPLLRRAAILELGGFDESLIRAEDADLWVRMTRLGYVFEDARHVGVAYRRTPNSLVLAEPSDQLSQLNAVFERADQEQPGLRGFGPRPIPEGLASLVPAAARCEQILPYLAMIAIGDVDKAVELGSEQLPEAVRSEIDIIRTARRLNSYVKARLSMERNEEVFEAETRIQQMLLRLRPQPESHWRSTVDIGEWSLKHERRGSAVWPTPPETASTEVSVEGSIVLIVEALYHVDEFGPLADVLRQRGHEVRFMLSPKTTPGAHSALGQYARTVNSYDLDSAMTARAIVVMNDWGPVRELIEKASMVGVPTFAKVEGVQDFDDCDTGRSRNPYQTASIILGQGSNDVKSLPSKRVEVVGSTRLERIWRSPPCALNNRVLVNLNFTFHVLTERRDGWVDSVRSAVRNAGLPARVSAHPADRTRGVGLPFANKPFRHEITEAGVLVSRFSTVPFEAMARGVPFVYHNPHGELVPTFHEPGGAFPITTTVGELTSALETAVGEGAAGRRAAWREFFLGQIDVVDDMTPEERTAHVIESTI